MKGIILAGGAGSRLFPLTLVASKQLQPVYDKPMVYYPIQTLVDGGIRDIMLVTGGRNSGDFLRLLANGKEFGLNHLNYTYQEGEGGIAEALGLCEHFSDGDKVCVILGDNIIEKNIRGAVEDFERQPQGAKILLKEVEDAERFGVAELRVWVLEIVRRNSRKGSARSTDTVSRRRPGATPRGRVNRQMLLASRANGVCAA